LELVSEVFVDYFVIQITHHDASIDFMSMLRHLLITNGLMNAGILPIENNKFKIACPDYDISTVLKFISLLETSDFHLICIDVTQDFAGSFDKEEVKQYWMENHDFVEQPFISKEYPSIIKHHDETHTCLQYLFGKSLRCKMYLKMAEILQSKSMRSNVGNRWHSWALKNHRLAISRDASLNRGLTRVEVTYYLDEDKFVNDLSTFTSLISLVTTPTFSSNLFFISQ
jgi:hypothetical protein